MSPHTNNQMIRLMVSTAPWSGDTIMAPSAVLSKPPRGVTSSPTATGCSSMWRSRMGAAGGWTTAISASRRPSPRRVAWHGARDARERRDTARKLLTRGQRPAERSQAGPDRGDGGGIQQLQGCGLRMAGPRRTRPFGVNWP